MNKLIVVGMRFYPEYARNRPTISEEVSLQRDPDNEVNPNAVEVIFEGNKIGHIRDADLPLLVGKKFPLIYKIERICTNYLQLRYSRAGIDKNNPYEDSSFIFADTAKHANEIFCYTSNGPTTYAEYDKMVQDQDKYVQEKVRKSARFDTPYGENPCSEVHITSFPPFSFNTEYDATLIKQPTEKKKMNFNTNSMRDSFFKEVTNVAMDMQTGKLGVVTSQGIITATDDGVSVNPITEMGFKIPAFAMRVPVADLAKGDIIIGNGDPVFFMEGSKVGYLTVNTNGVIQETGQVANMFFGKNTVMAVKNMFGATDAPGVMNPMMMFALMGDKKEGSGFGFKEMALMSMMSGNKDMGGMNPMMMFALMRDK